MGFFRSPFYIDKMPIFCYIVLFIACCGDQVLPLSFEGTNLHQEDHTMAKDTLKLVGTDRAVTDINIVHQRKEEARMLSEKNVRAVYNRSNQAQQRLAKLIEQNHGDPATVFAKLSPEQMESLRRCAELAKEANPEMNKDIIRMMRQVTKISASFERRTKRLEQGLDDDATTVTEDATDASAEEPVEETVETTLVNERGTDAERTLVIACLKSDIVQAEAWTEGMKQILAPFGQDDVDSLNDEIACAEDDKALEAWRDNFEDCEAAVTEGIGNGLDLASMKKLHDTAKAHLERILLIGEKLKAAVRKRTETPVIPVKPEEPQAQPARVEEKPVVAVKLDEPKAEPLAPPTPIEEAAPPTRREPSTPPPSAKPLIPMATLMGGFATPTLTKKDEEMEKTKPSIDPRIAETKSDKTAPSAAETTPFPETLRQSAITTLKRAEGACTGYRSDTPLADKLQQELSLTKIVARSKEQEVYQSVLTLEDAVAGKETNIVKVQAALTRIEKVIDDLQDWKVANAKTIDSQPAPRLVTPPPAPVPPPPAIPNDIQPDPFTPKAADPKPDDGSVKVPVVDVNVITPATGLFKGEWMKKPMLFAIFTGLMLCGIIAFLLIERVTNMQATPSAQASTSKPKHTVPATETGTANATQAETGTIAPSLPGGPTKGTYAMTADMFAEVQKARPQEILGTMTCAKFPKVSNSPKEDKRPYINWVDLQNKKHVVRSKDTDGSECFNVSGNVIVVP